MAIQMRCGVSLRLEHPLHPKSLIRPAHFGSEPPKQGVTAGQVRKFMTINGCPKPILPLGWLDSRLYIAKGRIKPPSHAYLAISGRN